MWSKKSLLVYCIVVTVVNFLLNEFCSMVRDLNVHIHHGGQFVDTNGTCVGSVEEKECDSDD
jgi:hypothetical protein